MVLTQSPIPNPHIQDNIIFLINIILTGKKIIKNNNYFMKNEYFFHSYKYKSIKVI